MLRTAITALCFLTLTSACTRSSVPANGADAPTDNGQTATTEPVLSAPEVGCSVLSRQDLTLDGNRISVVWEGDLGGTPEPELIVELHDTCGTGGCDGTVLTSCPGGYKPIGALSLWTAVEAVEPRTNGWLSVVSTGPIDPRTNQPSTFRSTYDGSQYRNAPMPTASPGAASPP